MMRLVLVLCGGVLAVVLLSGCASQSTVAREWYEPTETTALKHEENAPAP